MTLNLPLDSKLQQLYIDAVNYTEEIFSKRLTLLTILNDAANIYVEYEKELPEYLKEPLGKCLAHINQDFKTDYTFLKFLEEGDMLIDDLVIYIGKYLS